jgi:DNA polymerase-3 subunit delta
MNRTKNQADTSGGQSSPRPLKPAYLIVGDDAPKVETALKRLRQRIIRESGSDLNISEFDASAEGAATVVNAANTMAFLGGVRLVLVKHVEAWNRSEKEIVAAYLASPAPDACLCLVAESLPSSDLLRTAMQRQGEVLEYQAPRESDLPRWLQGEAARLGSRLGTREALLLVQRCGTNQNLLLRELEKLSLYAEAGPITEEDIHRLGSVTVEARVFDLVDALALGRGPAAFSTAADLLADGEEVSLLFSRILRHFQQLSRVAALREEGRDMRAIQEELKLKPYPAKKLFEQAAHLGSEGVARRLAILAEADARLKGMSPLPEEVELQLCLGRLLAA